MPKQQAEAIISAANVQTSEMINQSEITKRAYARANEIITQATQRQTKLLIRQSRMQMHFVQVQLLILMI